MKELPYPRNPLEAYQNACKMAEKVKEPLYIFCRNAAISYSTVWRWQDNTNSFKHSVYDGLAAFFYKRVKG